MDKLLVTIVAIFLIAGGTYFIFQNQKPNPQNNTTPIVQINSFEECVAAGNAVMESYPRQCNTPDGKHFVENVGNANEVSDLITVDSPRPNDTVKSPLTITGRARGTWYFEAQFPIKIVEYGTSEADTVDSKSAEIGTGNAKATSDWMTEDFVPFTATIEFSKPANQNPNGAIILKNDNPSGDPANDKQLIIPIKF